MNINGYSQNITIKENLKKARLVIKGFKQIEGIGYDKTYSATLSVESMRLVIAIASLHKWNIQQLDIKATYLNAPLNNLYDNSRRRSCDI